MYSVGAVEFGGIITLELGLAGPQYIFESLPITTGVPLGIAYQSQALVMVLSTNTTRVNFMPSKQRP